MSDKSDMDIFMEYMPAFSVWYKVLLTYLFQFLIFILVIIFFWWISSKFLLGAFIGECLIVLLGSLPFLYMTVNSDSIRDIYREKYGKLAAQKFWYNFQSYPTPILSAAFYTPLLLKTDYFLPTIIQFPSHFLTKSLLPIFIALPLSIFLIIFGLFIRKASQGYGSDEDHFLYMLYPKKGGLITQGIYRYIRHPRFLCRITITMGFGIFANNIIAIGVVLVHLSIFSLLLIPEDKELNRRFGNEFLKYKSLIPAIFPKYGNWKKFLRYVFLENKIRI